MPPYSESAGLRIKATRHPSTANPMPPHAPATPTTSTFSLMPDMALIDVNQAPITDNNRLASVIPKPA